MASPRAHGPPECPHGSPPRSPVPRQSAVSRPGRAPGGARAAPSDLECGPDSRAGRPGGAVTPHHPTPAPPLRAAAPAQTAGTLSARQAPRGRGEAGSPPSHRGEAVAWPGTPDLGTPERGPAADQPRDHQADEARHPADPDATTTATVALLRTAPSP